MRTFDSFLLPQPIYTEFICFSRCKRVEDVRYSRFVRDLSSKASIATSKQNESRRASAELDGGKFYTFYTQHRSVTLETFLLNEVFFCNDHQIIGGVVVGSATPQILVLNVFKRIYLMHTSLKLLPTPNALYSGLAMK